MIGTVVLASKRGYYFVADDETDRQYFLHASAVSYHTLLRAGDRVSFDIDERPQGRHQARAVNVVRIAAATTRGDSSEFHAVQQ
jgi:cold shock CspA family protein